uniref:VPS9 domain-containing protein n=1 Tax=Percolomonas cosmopolitus TaxID=63605 RepID=A0A7S1KTD5_9EUKA|mmetsp:Transcript_8794/g.32530  ORF Transcript_8794/g.32530 Transcript_8794/m.32530 type:complete len:818 (+) Transcript_8794:328-2781(+)
MSGLLDYELQNNPIILNLLTNSYKSLLKTLLRSTHRSGAANGSVNQRRQNGIIEPAHKISPNTTSSKKKKSSIIGNLDVSALFGGGKKANGTEEAQQDSVVEDDETNEHDTSESSAEPHTPITSTEVDSSSPGVYDLILLLPHSPSTTQLPHPLTLKTLFSYIAFFSPVDNKILSLNGIRMLLEDNRLLILDSEVPKSFDSLSREKQMEFQRDPAAAFRNEHKWDPSKPKKNILVLREAWISWSEESKEFFIVNSQKGSAIGDGQSETSTPEKSLSPVSNDTDEKFRLFLISNPVVDISPEELKASSSSDSKLNDLILAHNNSVSSISDELDHVPKSSSKAPSDQSSTQQMQVRKSNGPYTFKDFVDKMRHKNSSSLVKSLKKFIKDVNDRPYTDTLPRRVRKFLLVIMKEMERHPQWKDSSDLEMENAREGVEKYVMTKIFNKCFSSIEDVKVDQELSMRMSCFQSLPPSTLDIPQEVVAHDQWDSAKEELNKMNLFKTPRDKMICISNCCRILFNILQRINPEESAGADVFLPVLLYLVLQANPPCLHSNIKYINDYRNPDKMMSEAGYFLTNIQGAESFWLNCDATQLSINEEDFDRLLRRSYQGDGAPLDTAYTTSIDAESAVMDMSIMGTSYSETPPDKEAVPITESNAPERDETLSTHPIISEIRSSTQTEEVDSQGKLSEVDTEEEVAMEKHSISINIPMDKQQIITVRDSDDGKKPYFFPRSRSGSANNNNTADDTKSHTNSTLSSDAPATLNAGGMRKQISQILDTDTSIASNNQEFASLTIGELKSLFDAHKTMRQKLQSLLIENEL